MSREWRMVSLCNTTLMMDFDSSDVAWYTMEIGASLQPSSLASPPKHGKNKSSRLGFINCSHNASSSIFWCQLCPFLSLKAREKGLNPRGYLVHVSHQFFYVTSNLWCRNHTCYIPCKTSYNCDLTKISAGNAWESWLGTSWCVPYLKFSKIESHRFTSPQNVFFTSKLLQQSGEWFLFGCGVGKESSLFQIKAELISEFKCRNLKH